ncbi:MULTISPECIES: cupin domain-containing protein [Dyella]|uniref:Cupin domain-containing protein n=2 Tax=Dyella TaxID=231454 RepID=A0A4R0YJ00_9GAMM|nr:MULTISPECIES: cupin domain-containing protein [Dyella]TBR36519.1 cupin domain-containing protein [Dyella terrae]TCI08389.1 cupin domain-containing protein [Dyella soli]
MSHPRSLLKADAIAKMEPVSNAHPLNPESFRHKRALSDATGISQFGFHLIDIPPGKDSTEYHRHHYEEECIYIVEGCGEALIDDERFAVGAGDFMGFARLGAAHSLTNTGTGVLRLIVAGPRLEHDVCDYPHIRRRLHANGAMHVLTDLPEG